jgi:hypothetical protein
MKLIFVLILTIGIMGCATSTKKKKVVENTEIYSGICFDPKSLEYKKLDNVEMNSFDQNGFMAHIGSQKILLPNYCLFEQNYKVKKIVKLDPKRFTVKCIIDPFYWKTFQGNNYAIYKEYKGQNNVKIVDANTRQILLLSTEFCQIESED